MNTDDISTVGDLEDAYIEFMPTSVSLEDFVQDGPAESLTCVGSGSISAATPETNLDST